jgi:hypothetical protein
MKCKSFVVVCAIVTCAAALSPVDVAAQNNTVAALNAYRPPTPVIDVNEAAKKPVAYWTALHFGKPGEHDELPPGPSRLAEYKESEDFFVPDGMILVLDYANTVACFGPEEKMSIGIKTGYGEGKTPANLKILLTEQGVFNEPDGAYMHAGSSQPMKIYIRSGEAFRVTAWRSGAPGHAEAEFWLSGYLMPAALAARTQ